MQSEQETLVGVGELEEVLKEGSVQPLSDLHSLEAVIFALHGLEDEVSSLQKLKKKRIEAINVTMGKVEERMAFLKSIIFETLTHFKEKKVRFPSVGMVSKRKPRISFEVLNEKDLIDCLIREKESEGIVSERQVTDVDKHALNKLLLMWSKIGKLPVCVKEKKSENPVTVKFDNSDDDDDDDSAAPDIDFS